MGKYDELARLYGGNGRLTGRDVYGGNIYWLGAMRQDQGRSAFEDRRQTRKSAGRMDSDYEGGVLRKAARTVGHFLAVDVCMKFKRITRTQDWLEDITEVKLNGRSE